MKKLLLNFVALLVITSAKTQNNFPLPTDNPFWTEVHGMLWSCYTIGIHGYCEGYYCQCTMPVYYKSDTTINSVNYNRLYTRGVCYGVYAGGQPPDGCPFSFNFQNPEVLFATIRQDTLNKIVYILDNNLESILYDFKNIKVGEDYPQTFNNIHPDTLVVVAQDSLLQGNIYVKKWNLGIRNNGTISDSGFVSIIEGIGSTFGIVANLMPPFENSDHLVCFSKNNVVLYPDSAYNCDKTVNISNLITSPVFSVYPNPASNTLTIVTANASKGTGMLRISSATGEEILRKEIKAINNTIDISMLKCGVYIVQYSNERIIETVKFIKE